MTVLADSQLERYALDIGQQVLLADLGISLPDVLKRAKLSPSVLSAENASLSVPEFYALWSAIGDEANDPQLPMRIVEAITSDVFSPPLFAALCSADLEAAARRIAHYKPLIGPIRIGVERSQDRLTISVDWRSATPPPPILAAAELGFWLRLPRIATRSEILPIAAGMPVALDDAAPFEDYVGCEIEHTNRQFLAFSLEDADRPFLTADTSMWEIFEPQLSRRLHELSKDASVRDRTRSALIELLPGGEASVGEVARSLAMSPRTLQRRLSEEGLSFQEVLDETRESLAREYIGRGDLSPGQVSFLLGYKNPSSFYRAFQNWTGQTPAALRTVT